MEPNKIDTQIKDKLNNRTITPSAPSWDRLEAMLNSTENEKAKPNYNWLAIAAAVVVFFGLGMLYTTTPTSNPLNDNSSSIVAVNESKNISAAPSATIAVEKQSPILVQTNSNKINEKTIITEEKPIQELESIQKIVAQEIATNPKASPPANYKYISPESLLNEIQTGQKAITNNIKTVSKNKIKINAGSLLTGIEKELDSVYRETTLDKLNKNFNKIKTVIANRNFE
ncbi:MAG: hypothetical protein RLZZ236_901 [Bacteroidota bacterium]|jgi:hypothetical protein